MSPLSLPQVPRGVIILGLRLTLSLGPSHLRLEAAGHPRVGGRVGDGLRGHHGLELFHVQSVPPSLVDVDPLLLDPGDKPGPLDPLV